MRPSKFLFTALGPVAALVLFWVLTAQDQPTAVAITAAITLWTGLWWVFEPIPIPATSLLPLALFPAFSILTPQPRGVPLPPSRRASPRCAHHGQPIWRQQ